MPNNARHNTHRHSDIHKWITPGSEATSILVAEVPYATSTAVVFVRFKEGALLGNLEDISLPVKVLYLVIGSGLKEDCHGIGRVLGALTSYQKFRERTLTVESKEDYLHNIDDYMAESNVLPPGHFDHSQWTHSLTRWHDEEEKEERAKAKHLPPEALSSNELDGDEELEDDPLKRIGKPFAGLINDLKRKVPFYWSDFIDVFNIRCAISVIFIYFSFLAPAITFAAMLSTKTGGLMGVSEMIVSTAICGVVFGLFAGQPLIILGATGPLLVMEDSIISLAKLVGVEYLPWRGWIGIWIAVFTILVIAFDLCYLVNYFTLFTEEIIAACVAMVFIYEAIRLSYDMLTEHHEFEKPHENTTWCDIGNLTVNIGNCSQLEPEEHDVGSDGSVLMTLVLLFGTALLAYHILNLRNSRYFPRILRRLLSDFGTLISVAVFAAFEFFLRFDHTTKLDIPEGFTPTSPSKRDWLIPLMGKTGNLPILAIILASIPALMVTIILFMETELTGVLVDRKEHKLRKGCGYNLDFLTVGLLVGGCSVFGLPWMCACPVHSLQHLHSLAIYNNNHIPGTQAKIEKVQEQRVTNILMHILIGLTVFIEPALKNIPLACLLGIFLYLGLTTLTHLNLSERVKLLLIPAHHHPDIALVRNLKTKKIHTFTIIQLACVLLIFGCKYTPLAPLFPFLIMLTVPLRYFLARFFNEDELYELDEHHEGEDGEMDEMAVVGL